MSLETMKQYERISNKSIVAAVNYMSQLQYKQLAVGSQEELKRREAATTLIDAGKKRVREVCKSSLGSVNPVFWATQQELNIARELTIDYVKQGPVIIKDFKKVGLNKGSFLLARITEKYFPSLTRLARRKLFFYQSKIVKEELNGLENEFDDNEALALRKLGSVKNSSLRKFEEVAASEFANQTIDIKGRI